MKDKQTAITDETTANSIYIKTEKQHLTQSMLFVSVLMTSLA